MLVTARMNKDIAQLPVGGASNPGSREVLSPTNLVLELPALHVSHHKLSTYLVAYRNTARLASGTLFLVGVAISER